MKTLSNSGRFYWKPHQNFQLCVSLLFFLVLITYTGGVSKGIRILNQPLKMLTGEADCRLTCVLRLLYNSFLFSNASGLFVTNAWFSGYNIVSVRTKVGFFLFHSSLHCKNGTVVRFVWFVFRILYSIFFFYCVKSTFFSLFFDVLYFWFIKIL